MVKHIVSVGFEIPGPTIKSIPFHSNESLLDADIVIFSPNVSSYQSYEAFAGKRLLTESDSAQLRTHAEHWRTELATALEHGKTIFLIMSAEDDFYMYTGSKQATGTGRGARECLTASTIGGTW